MRFWVETETRLPWRRFRTTRPDFGRRSCCIPGRPLKVERHGAEFRCSRGQGVRGLGAIRAGLRPPSPPLRKPCVSRSLIVISRLAVTRSAATSPPRPPPPPPGSLGRDCRCARPGHRDHALNSDEPRHGIGENGSASSTSIRRPRSSRVSEVDAARKIVTGHRLPRFEIHKSCVEMRCASPSRDDRHGAGDPPAVIISPHHRGYAAADPVRHWPARRCRSARCRGQQGAPERRYAVEARARPRD